MARTLLTSLLTRGALAFAAAASSHAATFTFETDTLNKATPFTDTVSGLSATFGGAASVCGSSGLFASLSGQVLIQSLCGPNTENGTLSISFSSDISNLAFNFATAGAMATLNLSAFENSTPVGTANFMSVVPTGRFSGEGFATFGGTFNRVTLNTSTFLALDNVNATTVPEPASLAMIVAGLGGLLVLSKRLNQSFHSR